MELEINLRQQRLQLWDQGRVLSEYAVSTGGNGVGEINGSGCTPRGRHVIRARIGGDQPAGSVFRARRPTGEIWTQDLHARYPGRDWILTRILWLSGTERGRNRLGCVDTFRRYIYLHGTPPTTRLGLPGSKGCIRMANTDIIALYDQIGAGTVVELHN